MPWIFKNIFKNKNFLKYFFRTYACLQGPTERLYQIKVFIVDFKTLFFQRTKEHPVELYPNQQSVYKLKKKMVPKTYRTLFLEFFKNCFLSTNIPFARTNRPFTITTDYPFKGYPSVQGKFLGITFARIYGTSFRGLYRRFFLGIYGISFRGFF